MTKNAVPRLAIALLVASLVPVLAAASDRTSSRPALSLFAGGSFRPGWWSLDIDRSGRISASYRASERLTPTQERELAALVRALPTGKRKYAFGEAYVDVTTTFVLTVGEPPDVREYMVTDTLEADATKPEVQRIVAVLRFLYGLLYYPDVIPPP